jgi:hypothetical protein
VKKNVLIINHKSGEVGFLSDVEVMSEVNGQLTGGWKTCSIEDLVTFAVEAMPRQPIKPMDLYQTAKPTVCPYHGVALSPSKKVPGQLYCQAKNPDGSYCKFKA